MDTQDRPDPLAIARDLGAAIAAAADAIERTRRIPEPLLARLHAFAAVAACCCRARSAATRRSRAPTCWRSRRSPATTPRVAWNVFVANSSALIAAFLEPAVARTIFADPRTIVAWGPPNATRASRRCRGLSRHAAPGISPAAAGNANWMGAHCHVVEADGSLRLNRLGRPVIRTLLFPAEQATLIDTWNTIGLRGTASDSYSVADLFVPEAFSTTREEPELRRERGPLYAFTMQGLYAVGVASVALGHRAGDARRVHRPGHAGRRRARWRVSPTTRSCRRTWPGRRRGSARRAPICSTRWRRSTRGRTTSIRSTLPTARGCGSPAPTPSMAPSRSPTSPTRPPASTRSSRAARSSAASATSTRLSQQIQSRSAHFEAVGQVLLGMPPEVFL